MIHQDIPNQREVLPPFSASYTPQLPDLLLQLNCTITLTTYQAGKVVFVSPSADGERLTTLPRDFDKPMGLALNGDSMAIATNDEVVLLQNSKELAEHYPNKQNVYDALWLPKATFYTGRVDLHDIAYGSDGVYCVNTSFSCISKLDTQYNFVPVWQPPFIKDLSHSDQCHMNGMVMQDGKPKFISALGATDTPQGWRDNIVDGGIIMDVTKNEIIAKGLAMPHSPKIYNGYLYFLQSAKGELSRMDLSDYSIETVKTFSGFCRGLDFIGEYAIIGFSKLRKNSSTFAKLKFSDEANFAGFKLIHLPTNAEVGEFIYQTSVDEIYEVSILPDMIRPNILNTQNPIHKYSLSIPGKSFWANPGDFNQ